ncbi:MAG: hypothetical protein QXN62_05970 [Candidatus Bathyarchaeia archaeon]|nr:hypothetical protein [Candidatus Bathyarchaeota archaeon]
MGILADEPKPLDVGASHIYRLLSAAVGNYLSPTFSWARLCKTSGSEGYS